MSEKAITMKTIFRDLNAIDVSDKVKKKNDKLDYLDWATCLTYLKSKYDTVEVKVREFSITTIGTGGEVITRTVPYNTDGRTAYVEVELTIDGVSVTEMLPVLDYRNQCIPVDKLTFFDVSKSIKRCFVKAAANHGIGLSMWTRETETDLAKEKKILDRLDRQDAIGKFKAKIKEGYDRDKLAAWLQTNFGGCKNPMNLSDELLERLNEELDKLDIKDFQTEKKSK